MSVLMLCNSFRSLSCGSVTSTSVGALSRSFSACTAPLYFKLTTSLYAEPLKKKKRLDPAVVKAREEKRRKRLEKQIRRLEKNSRQLKPIDELEVPIVLMTKKSERTRKPPILTAEELDERVLISKAWSAYKLKTHLKDVQMIDRIMYSQQRALDELRKESEELYQAAIQVDPNLLPYTVKGPVLTPPVKDFDAPDGEYIDISKKWD